MLPIADPPVGLGLLFTSIVVIFRFVVTRRLVTMARHFDDIAAHTGSPWMTPVPVKGNDEISVVGVAFNKLVEQLRPPRTPPSNSAWRSGGLGSLPRGE